MGNYDHCKDTTLLNSVPLVVSHAMLLDIERLSTSLVIYQFFI